MTYSGNWIGLTTIEDFLETKDVLMYGTDAEGVYFGGRKHIDVYSMKQVERAYTPDYGGSPEVKAEDFKDLLVELFGLKKWEGIWEEFEEWRQRQ
jgi:hypothetical protein